MKTLVLFASMEENLLNKLSNVKKHINLDDYKIHLFTCHEVQTYMADLVVYSYPTPEQHKEMEEATNRVLFQFANEAGFSNFEVHTVFDSNYKERCKNFLEDINADLAVVSTRESRGIFESSFTTYLCKNSECDVLVVK